MNTISYKFIVKTYKVDLEKHKSLTSQSKYRDKLIKLRNLIW